MKFKSGCCKSAFPAKLCYKDIFWLTPDLYLAVRMSNMSDVIFSRDSFRVFLLFVMWTSENIFFICWLAYFLIVHLKQCPTIRAKIYTWHESRLFWVFVFGNRTRLESGNRKPNSNGKFQLKSKVHNVHNKFILSKKTCQI